MTNNGIIADMIDKAIGIARDCVCLENISEPAWEKAADIGELANQLKNEILDLEKIIIDTQIFS